MINQPKAFCTVLKSFDNTTGTDNPTQNNATQRDATQRNTRQYKLIWSYHRLEASPCLFVLTLISIHCDFQIKTILHEPNEIVYLEFYISVSDQAVNASDVVETFKVPNVNLLTAKLGFQVEFTFCSAVIICGIMGTFFASKHVESECCQFSLRLECLFPCKRNLQKWIEWWNAKLSELPLSYGKKAKPAWLDFNLIFVSLFWQVLVQVYIPDSLTASEADYVIIGISVPENQDLTNAAFRSDLADKLVKLYQKAKGQTNSRRKKRSGSTIVTVSVTTFCLP